MIRSLRSAQSYKIDSKIPVKITNIGLVKIGCQKNVFWFSISSNIRFVFIMDKIHIDLKISV